MLWTGRSCRRRQCWLWRKRKRAAGPTSAPKLRQNRFNCKNLTSKMLVYTSTDDEFVVFKEFRMTLLVFNPDSLVLWINARREMVC